MSTQDVLNFEIPSEEDLRANLATSLTTSLTPAERAAVKRRFQLQAAEYMAEHGEEVPWSSPQDLPLAEDPVPTLGAELLVEPFRAWLADAAERTSVPLEFIAVPALVAAGAVIGRSVAVRPMALDDWREVPNLWGAVVGPPGVMKTAVLAEALRPVRRLEAESRRRFDDAEKDRSIELEVLKARRTAVLSQMGKAAKKDPQGMDSLRDEMRLIQNEEREGEVRERRFSTSDATIEKLGMLLNENPRGLLIVRDELTGWLRGLDRDDRAQDRAFMLEAWNGAGRFTVDRVGRGTLHVEALCLTVLGGIQPGRLRPYVLGTVAQDEEADGLLPRLQLVVWPDSFGDWKAVDRWPAIQGAPAAQGDPMNATHETLLFMFIPIR